MSSRLSDEAGAELLRDNDVWGVDSDLKAASHDFGGHPLALTLLASLLKETQNGDVRRRDHIRGLLADADNPRHDQARRVMESYEKEWLAGQPILLAILHCVGLFDRPASGDCLTALRARARHSGTDRRARRPRATINGAAPSRACARRGCWRRPTRPIRKRSTPIRWCANGSANGCKATNEAAWKDAHGRLYDHLRDTTHEGQTPTLADLAPLYHAIAHGCRAGRQQEALDEVYENRICRRLPDGAISSSMPVNKLGAVGSDLAAISWFFDRPYETPVAALTPCGPRLGPQRGRLSIARTRAPSGGAAGDARGARTCAKRRRIGETRRSARQI